MGRAKAVKALAIYVASMLAIIGGYALVAGIPLDMAFRIALLVELCAAATMGFVAVLRYTSRHPAKRQAPPPPVERVTAEVVPVDDSKPNPRALVASDPRRYEWTGTVGNYGEVELVDRRTGRRGVDVLSAVRPGARIDDDGRVVYDDPVNNPFQGVSW